LPSRQKRIELALQGGGTHGAFTWGVLDRLLADDAIAIEGVSGTSAGAMSAVVVADGLVRGSRSGDVVEVAPQYDPTTVTAQAGAQMPFQLLCLMVLAPSFRPREAGRA
jgi:hypothetical protein